DADVLYIPLAFQIVESEIWGGDATTIDRCWKTEGADQSAPSACSDKRTNLAESKHIRQCIAARSCRLIDDHHLWTIDTSDRRRAWSPVTQREVSHEFSIEFVDDVIRHHAALVVALVNYRAFLVLLRVVVAGEIRVTGVCGVRQPHVREFSVREF